MESRRNIPAQLERIRENNSEAYGYSSSTDQFINSMILMLGTASASVSFLYLVQNQYDDPLVLLAFATSLGVLYYVDRCNYFALPVDQVTSDVRKQMERTSTSTHDFPLYESLEGLRLSHIRTMLNIGAIFMVSLAKDVPALLISVMAYGMMAGFIFRVFDQVFMNNVAGLQFIHIEDPKPPTLQAPHARLLPPINMEQPKVSTDYSTTSRNVLRLTSE